MQQQRSQFVLVSCEESCCPKTKRVEKSLATFGISPTRIRLKTLEGMAMRLHGMGQALFVGVGVGTPVLFVVDEETGEKLWAGENPAETEIDQAVYLAGNFV